MEVPEVHGSSASRSRSATPLQYSARSKNDSSTGGDECRIAWERDADPLAVCVAIAKCDAIPKWLQNGALALLTGDEYNRGTLRGFSRRLWARRNRDAIDAARAAEVARWRAHPELPQTWKRSYLAAKIALSKDNPGKQYADAVPVDIKAMERSYQLVRRRLDDRGRYYAAVGFMARLDLAFESVASMIKRGGPSPVEVRPRQRRSRVTTLSQKSPT
jgi:hypothetical protein